MIFYRHARKTMPCKCSSEDCLPFWVDDQGRCAGCEHSLTPEQNHEFRMDKITFLVGQVMASRKIDMDIESEPFVVLANKVFDACQSINNFKAAAIVKML